MGTRGAKKVRKRRRERIEGLLRQQEPVRAVHEKLKGTRDKVGVSTIYKIRKQLRQAQELEKQTFTKLDDPLRIERRREHIKGMTSVAEAMLGALGGVEYKGEDDYEIMSCEAGTASSTHDEVIKDLIHNIDRAHEEYRVLGLFDCFLAHLEAEESACHDPVKYARSDPRKLIDLLKILILKKEFKGTCPVCKDW